MNKHLKLAQHEYQRSNGLYPMFNSNYEGYAVIKEEVDELWDEIKKAKTPSITSDQQLETVQIMAMCIKFVESFAKDQIDPYALAEQRYYTIKTSGLYNSTHEGYAFILSKVDLLWSIINNRETVDSNFSELYVCCEIIAVCIILLESFSEEK